MGFSIPQVLQAVAGAYPDREALVFRDRRFTFSQLMQRCNRLARFLIEHDVTIQQPRSALRGWESGQDHVAIYMQNCNEYLESMIGAMQARAIGYNVNFRYVAEELEYLLSNADTKAIIYQASYAPLLAEILPSQRNVKLLIQVADESGNELLPGAWDYEAALASCSPALPETEPSGDDLYIIYTGGTTGMPKAVLWRQEDSLVANLSGADKNGDPLSSLSQFVQRSGRNASGRTMAAPPFMHGTGQYVALAGWNAGSTVVVQDTVDRLDAKDMLSVIAREKVTVLSIVGDAFARPLLEEMAATEYDLSSLKALINSGAVLSQKSKQRFIDKIPGLRIMDYIGSSESPTQATQVSSAGDVAEKPSFKINKGACVLSEDLSRVLEPGHEGLGWLARTGRMPLGYLGDEKKTLQTFPTVDGVRYCVPGDRVRLLESGELEFLGRDSVTINSGGEKIFAEEVEQALSGHDDVVDVAVASRPSERWGNEVVALVQLRPGAGFDNDALLAEAGRHIARYKLPKLILQVDRVQRGPNGKMDYRWANQLAAETLVQ